MMRNLEHVFSLTSFLDKARWHSKDNYNLINFFSNELSSDDKLLTHWLCYITDRQMGFERIWDVAGFIFSDMVFSVRTKKDITLLNSNIPSQSYFIKTSDFSEYIGNPINFPSREAGFIFVGRHKIGKNKTLSYYGFSQDEYAIFSSRYYPSDFRSILFTLVILADFQYSLTDYIINVLNRNISKPNIIKRLLFSLYLLTYAEIGQPSKGDIDFEKWHSEGIARKNKVLKVLSNESLFEDSFDDFCRNQIFKQKRAWCSLRDFFKSPEFRSFFFSSLKEHGFNQLSSLCNEQLLRQFELPGDVWNNNSTFRQCMLSGTSKEYENLSLPFNKLLRKIFEKEQIADGYPEQFDVTFDFVPRMCDKRNCDLCLYGKDIGYGKDIDKICVKDSSKYCPIVLSNCGYKVLCNQNNCELVKLKYV